MTLTRNLRQAGLFLALLVTALAFCLLTWAQSGDTPIVISDGSLRVDSAVPWNQYTGSGDVRTHPHATKSVTKVVATVAGADHTVTFNNQECIVDFVYAGKHITIRTNHNGKNLTFRPFSAFRAGDTPNTILHTNPNAKISHVRILQAGKVAFESDASGGTKISVDYQ